MNGQCREDRIPYIYICIVCIPAPSNRSPPATFKSAKASRGDLSLLEGAGIYIYICTQYDHCLMSYHVFITFFLFPTLPRDSRALIDGRRWSDFVE